MLLPMEKPEGKRVAAAFGKALKEQRQVSGLTQEELAHAAGVDRTYISLLERGGRQPTLTTLIAIAEILGVAPLDLCRATFREYELAS